MIEEKESSQNNIADPLYSYIKEFALLKLESENQRENSLIQQSAHMQTAFSFVTAALFMVAPIAVEYRGLLSLQFLLMAFASITFFMLLSLTFASMAQNRQLVTAFPDIEDFTSKVEDDYESYVTVAQREKALSVLMGQVQKSKCLVNEKRGKRIKWSMRFFYCALFLSVFWFIIALLIMF